MNKAFDSCRVERGNLVGWWEQAMLALTLERHLNAGRPCLTWKSNFNFMSDQGIDNQGRLTLRDRRWGASGVWLVGDAFLRHRR